MTAYFNEHMLIEQPNETPGQLLNRYQQQARAWRHRQTTEANETAAMFAGDFAHMLEQLTSALSAALSVQPSMREQTAEHRWAYIFQERPNELSMRCSCGWLWKHLPMDHMRSVTLPRCPDEQLPTSAEPVSIDDLAPGTTFEYGERWTVANNLPGRPPHAYRGLEARYLTEFDPSTIRDVTPLPATPEESDRG
jgi:hypothetical protein